MTEIKEINIKQAHPNLVRQLKLLLEDAENGEVVGIAGVVYYHNGGTSEHWVDCPKTYDYRVTGDRMIGCLERLKNLLLNVRNGVEMSDDILGHDPREPE